MKTLVKTLIGAAIGGLLTSRNRGEQSDIHGPNTKSGTNSGHDGDAREPDTESTPSFDLDASPDTLTGLPADPPEADVEAAGPSKHVDSVQAEGIENSDFERDTPTTEGPALPADASSPSSSEEIMPSDDAPTPPQKAFLHRITERPGTPDLDGINGNTILACQRRGWAESDEDTPRPAKTGTWRVTEAGAEALSRA